MGRRPSPPLPTRAPLSGCPSLWDPRLGEGLQVSPPVTASLASCFTGKMWPRRPTGRLRSQFLEEAGSWWARAFSSALFSPDPPTQRQGSRRDLEGRRGRVVKSALQPCLPRSAPSMAWGWYPGAAGREGTEGKGLGFLEFSWQLSHSQLVKGASQSVPTRPHSRRSVCHKSAGH